MPARKFDYKFEDLGRRPDTPVDTSGFGDMEEPDDDPDAAFVDVDLAEEDAGKAVSVPEDTELAAKAGKKSSDADKEEKRARRREALLREQEIDRRVEEKLGEARKEVAGEINTLKEKVAKTEISTATAVIDAEYDDERSTIEAEMEEAMEASDHEKVTRLTSRLVALNTEHSEKKLKVEREHQPDEPQDLDAGEQRRPASKRAQQFVRSNTSWWADPDHEDTVDYAKRLDVKLVQLGLDPESDAYWSKFNRTFDKKFPDLRNTELDDDDIVIDVDDPAPGRKPSHVQPPGNPGGSGGGSLEVDEQKGNKVRLKARHKRNMVKFGLDPNDPDDCANYAKNVEPEKRRAS